MRRLATLHTLAAVGALSIFATACSSEGNRLTATPSSPAPTPAPGPAPTPTPTPTPTSFNVTRCLNQQVALGTSVTNLVIPDTLTLDLTKPSGFPNGRDLDDPVVDLTLAVLLLDLTRHPADTFARVPLNPPSNDVPLRNSFPYFAAAQGNPPLPPPGGPNYDFRTEPSSAFVRVDRMGEPAVATALISSSKKTPYNDDDPADDVTGKYVQEITATLTGITNSLADDLQRLNLTMCATPG